MCLIGALIASVGLILASFSWNMASLLVTYSFITGTGFGLMYIPAVVAVAQHFTTKQAFALGLCVCGSGMGTFILAPLEHYLLSQVGWRWTFVCMGGVCSLCLFCGAAMRPIKQLTITEGSIVRDDRSALLKLVSLVFSDELLSSPFLKTYLIITFAGCTASMALYIPYTYLPDESTYSGMTPDEASYLIAVIGISSSVGRILSGWLCDRSCCNPAVLTVIVLAFAPSPLFLFPWITNYILYLAFSCLFGFLTGIWIAAISPLLVKVLGTVT